MFIRGWSYWLRLRRAAQYPQDAILQDCALAGTPEHRQSPADLQSAIRQISNLRYAKQIQSLQLCALPAPSLSHGAGAPRSARPVVNRYAAEGRGFMPGFVRFADTICKKGTNPLPIMPSRAAIPFWHLRCSRRSRNRRVPVRSLWLATTALHGVMSSLPVQGPRTSL